MAAAFEAIVVRQISIAARKQGAAAGLQFQPVPGAVAFSKDLASHLIRRNDVIGRKRDRSPHGPA